MAYNKQKKFLAEKDVEDFLAGQKKDALLSSNTAIESRGRAESNLGNIAQSLSERYGFSPNLATATKTAFQPIKREVGISTEQTKEMQGIANRRKVFNYNFNFALNRFQNSGLDRKIAEEEAMKFALDQDERKYKSKVFEEGRAQAIKKQDISDEFSDRYSIIKRDREEDNRRIALRNSVLSSLFGLGSSIATGFILKGRS